MLLKAEARPVHHAVPHRGRTSRPKAPRLPAIPAKYRARPKPKPPSLKLPSAGKLGKAPAGGKAVPVPLASGHGNPYRVSIPHPVQPVSPYVNPFGATVVGGRIDQGVDYTGTPGQAIGALGPGKITLATSGSGWPGGGFIVERLSAGPAKGKYVYTAEDVKPLVTAGQKVKAGQAIGQFNQGGWIEAGWGGSATQDVTLANVTGQSGGSVPVGAGAYSTGFGIAFDRLVRKLGGPGGQVASTVSGGAPPLFSSTGGKVPGAHRVSLPPASLPNTMPSGVNPPASGGTPSFRLAAAETPIRRHGGTSPPPTRAPRHHLLDFSPTPGGVPGAPPSVTTVRSSKGIGGITSFAAPSTGSSGGGTSTLLLVAGAGVVLVILLMRKGKVGKRG